MFAAELQFSRAGHTKLVEQKFKRMAHTAPPVGEVYSYTKGFRQIASLMFFTTGGNWCCGKVKNNFRTKNSLDIFFFLWPPPPTFTQDTRLAGVAAPSVGPFRMTFKELWFLFHTGRVRGCVRHMIQSSQRWCGALSSETLCDKQRLSCRLFVLLSFFLGGGGDFLWFSKIANEFFCRFALHLV